MKRPAGVHNAPVSFGERQHPGNDVQTVADQGRFVPHDNANRGGRDLPMDIDRLLERPDISRQCVQTPLKGRRLLAQATFGKLIQLVFP